MKDKRKLYNLTKNELFPLCRSITGKGIYKSFIFIKKHFPKLKIFSIRSGEKVFDWRVPDEWNINKAFILDKNGKKIIDFKNNNLHVVNYSKPVNKFINKKNLLKKLYSYKSQPNAIPYVTSYYKKDWGFCCTYKQQKELDKKYKNEDLFKVLINSNLNKKGKLKFAEYFIKGKSKQEILISTYLCHPSMANNELSGPLVSMFLIDYFSSKVNNKSLRFIFIPETIGSLVFIHKNRMKLKNIIGAFNLTCIGDDKMHSCMLSKYKNSLSDRALLTAYKKLNIKYKVFPFSKRGSDERQFNSPFVDLKMTSIFRSKYNEYKQYHSSEDDFNFISFKGISGGYKIAKEAIKILDQFVIPKSTKIGEPFLSKYNLYDYLSIKKRNKKNEVLDFLQFSDGNNEISDIRKILKLNDNKTKNILKTLLNNKLVQV